MKSLFFLLFILINFVNASPMSIGSNIGNITLKDQFDAIHPLEHSSDTLVIVFERELSGKLNDYLAKKPKEYLRTKNTFFIADISQMPTFISESFALPKMRQYGYNILLIRDEELSLLFPYEENRITVMKMDNGKILSIKFASSVEEALE